MSQTPTYWRKVKLRLIEGAIAYADVLDLGDLEEEQQGRALTTTYSRYTWDLFEIGPRNVAAIAERDLVRRSGEDPTAVLSAKETLIAAAKALAKVEALCNDPDLARRQIWGQAHRRYDDAIEALGPRLLAAIVLRDLPERYRPNQAIVDLAPEDADIDPGLPEAPELDAPRG
ncbi:hypothetical protein LJR290_007476 [Variovorax sp. LjRoot290]|uniref:hypothetical protein n=1 Tax=Variovorax sp. LjRoot290 TaxID=3342316 RepID=UPI003ECC790D